MEQKPTGVGKVTAIRMTIGGVVLGVMILLGYNAVGQAPGESVVRLVSTQLALVEEAQMMREEILADFPGAVEFFPTNEGALESLISTPLGEPYGLVGGTHGLFISMVQKDLLQPLPNVEGLNRVSPSMRSLGRLGTSQQYYTPWMQATYLMVANRKALPYLPEGADLNRLTYDELVAWGQNMAKAQGRSMLGFPVGNRGLMHRFLQGYAYPSYTGGMITRMNTPEAHQMWGMLQELWEVVHPASIEYSNMSVPLLADEVWVAWDHTVRLKPALEERPQDFVAFPAPAGPAGRGYYLVVAGLAIPKGAPQQARSTHLIEYLLQESTQLQTLMSVGFFPVLEGVDFSAASPAIELLAKAVSTQSSTTDALPAVLPVGLGDSGADFNTVFMLGFSQIVIRGRSSEQVVPLMVQQIQKVIEATGAPCWAPDPISQNVCRVQ